MRKLRLALAALICITLCSCGPIIGRLMTAGGGVDDFDVISGDLSAVEAGSEMVIIAPFMKGPDGSYLSRGDDAANLMDAMNEAGTFKTSLYFESDYVGLNAATAKLKELGPAELKVATGLKTTPRYLMTGTILGRDTITAPTRGIMMEVSYRLEIVEIETKKSVTIDVTADDLYPRVTPAIAEELKKGMR
jgi:hypothetical protein